MTERTLKTGDRAKRPQRVPVSGQRDLITIKGKDPDFYYRIVSDKPGRIDKFLAAGYEIVTHDVQVGEGSSSRDNSEGSPVKVNLGRGQQGYLMRQPHEYHEEDQAAKEDELRAREETLTQKPETYGKLEIRQGSRS